MITWISGSTWSGGIGADISIAFGKPDLAVFFFFFLIRHSFTIEDLVSAPNL